KTSGAVDERVRNWIAERRRRARNERGAILVMPALAEIEPQCMDVTVGRTKQVVLLDNAGWIIDQHVPRWIGDGRGHWRRIRAVGGRGSTCARTGRLCNRTDVIRKPEPTWW